MRPRRVYDPFTGAADHRRSAEGAHAKPEYVNGIALVGDKAYIEVEDVERTVLGWRPDEPLGRGATIRGTRLA